MRSSMEDNYVASARRDILVTTFGTAHSYICDVVRHLTLNTEFEVRIADKDTHCSLERWNTWNRYLCPYTEMTHDTIVTYSNPSFQMFNKVLRRFEIGQISEEKTLISRFTSEESFPLRLMAKTSIERRVQPNQLHLHHPLSRTVRYRRSYRIQFPHLKYLECWSVDKTVRFLENLNEVRGLKNINEPIGADILDMEFEYEGDREHLEDALVSLVRFLTWDMPVISRQICFEYRIYDSLLRGKLSDLFPKQTNRTFKNAKQTLTLPDGKFSLMIHIDKDNYIVLDERSIDCSHFKGFDMFHFSVYAVWLSDQMYILDTYVHQEIVITNRPFEDRSAFNLKLATPTSKQSAVKVTLYDDCKVCSVQSTCFEINLRVTETRTNVYMLSASNAVAASSIPIRSPLLVTNEWKDLNHSREVTIADGSVKRFRCDVEDGVVTMVESNEELYETPTDITSFEYTVLEAYADARNVQVEQLEMTDDDRALQIVMEQEAGKERSGNLLLIGDHPSFSIKNASGFLRFDRLILWASPEAIVRNMVRYYSTDMVPTIGDAKRRINVDSEIRVLERSEPLSRRSFFDNDMQQIMTSVCSFETITDLMDTFDQITRNRADDSTVFMTYKLLNVNPLAFVYGATSFVDFKGMDKKDISSRLKEIFKSNQRCLLRTINRIGYRGRHSFELIRTVNESEFYYAVNIERIPNSPTVVLARNAIMSEMQSGFGENVDPIPIALRSLSETYGFATNLFYPMDGYVCCRLLF